jgi:hypothetical protein
MAQRAMQDRGVSTRVACEASRLSQTCYRYVAKTDVENQEIANWLLRLTVNHRNWGLELRFLYLPNVRGFAWNPTPMYRICRELELKLGIGHWISLKETPRHVCVAVELLKSRSWPAWIALVHDEKKAFHGSLEKPCQKAPAREG